MGQGRGISRGGRRSQTRGGEARSAGKCTLNLSTPAGSCAYAGEDKVGNIKMPHPFEQQPLVELHMAAATRSSS